MDASARLRLAQPTAREARSEALFASTLQPSDAPPADMKRIRIDRPRIRREQPWPGDLPPDPRDPDVVRAKLAAACRGCEESRSLGQGHGYGSDAQEAGRDHRPRHSAGRHLAAPSGNHSRGAEAGPRTGAHLVSPAVPAEAAAMASLLRDDHPRRGRVLYCAADNAATEEIQPGAPCRKKWRTVTQVGADADRDRANLGAASDSSAAHAHNAQISIAKNVALRSTLTAQIGGYLEPFLSTPRLTRTSIFSRPSLVHCPRWRESARARAGLAPTVGLGA
jgi:hypothetical protein